MPSRFATVGQASRVDILLATYNGAPFVEQQIESILDQMDSGCRLLVRDDGSSDGTLSIVQRFASRRKHDMVVLDDRLPRLGACRTFGALLEQSDADYVVLCDQDDVWLPGRIAKPLQRIRAAEEELGTGTPILAHSDLVVVDKNLDTIAPSFWAYNNLDPHAGSDLNRLLVQNVVTGCATMVNRALVRLASPIPVASVPMHDWWLALVAAAFGRIETIDEPTVLYRQHAGNQLGATCYDWRYVGRHVREALFSGGVARKLRRAQEQAQAFLRKFASNLDPQRSLLVSDFLRLRNAGFLCRRQLLLQHGFLGTGRLRNLGWLLMI